MCFHIIKQEPRNTSQVQKLNTNIIKYHQTRTHSESMKKNAPFSFPQIPKHCHFLSQNTASSNLLNQHYETKQNQHPKYYTTPWVDFQKYSMVIQSNPSLRSNDIWPVQNTKLHFHQVTRFVHANVKQQVWLTFSSLSQLLVTIRILSFHF